MNLRSGSRPTLQFLGAHLMAGLALFGAGCQQAQDPTEAVFDSQTREAQRTGEPAPVQVTCRRRAGTERHVCTVTYTDRQVRMCSFAADKEVKCGAKRRGPRDPLVVG